ncbi:imm11 family protein [Sorangium sp. So ce542]|uniref:imm11 family protein n=1 Tax=Sorangium sp. So ce542 TaxID=3133316 RepID=UPI003F615EA3
MNKGFVVWESDAGSKLCAANGLKNVSDEYEITRGVSRAKGFPEDARFEMDKRYPKQVALPDSLSNLEGMVVVSPRLKAFVEARSPRSVEYLPVALINHKDRDCGQQYHIVNPLEIVDCIDQDASKIEFNDIDPTLIAIVKRLVFKQNAIPEDLLLFRPKYLENAVVVRRDLAEAIEGGKFTGVRFTEIDKYRE